MTSPTPFQLLPRLSDEEYEALKADIAEHGVRVPIDVDESGVILDGHHRAWITADLDVDCPRRVVSGLDEQGKRDYARAVNALRRHLTVEQRRQQVAQMRAEGRSIRQISQTLGIPKSTVSDDVSQLSGSGQLAQPERITGIDGRTRAASRPESDPDIWTEPDDEQIPGQSHILDHTELETVTPTVTVAQSEAAKPKRRPLTEALADATRDFARAAERLDRLREDDRFTRNRDQTHHQMPELLGALNHATNLLQAMNLHQAQASEEARRWWATSLNTLSDTLRGVAHSINQEN